MDSNHTGPDGDNGVIVQLDRPTERAKQQHSFDDRDPIKFRLASERDRLNLSIYDCPDDQSTSDRGISRSI